MSNDENRTLSKVLFYMAMCEQAYRFYHQTGSQEALEAHDRYHAMILWYGPQN